MRTSDGCARCPLRSDLGAQVASGATWLDHRGHCRREPLPCRIAASGAGSVGHWTSGPSILIGEGSRGAARQAARRLSLAGCSARCVRRTRCRLGEKLAPRPAAVQPAPQRRIRRRHLSPALRARLRPLRHDRRRPRPSSCPGRPPRNRSAVTSPASPATMAASMGFRPGAPRPLTINRKGTNAMSAKILWGQILVVFPIIPNATTWGATPICRLEPRLSGATRLALVRAVRGWPSLSAALFWWWYFCEGLCAGIFARAGSSQRLGGFIAIAVAIGMSVWRARGKKNVDHGGSARWAERRRSEGGTARSRRGRPGAAGRRYLRHDDRSMCCVSRRPFRQGRRSIPPVATLTWPGSAIVHDIGRELAAHLVSPRHGRCCCSIRPTGLRPPIIRCSRSGAANGGPRRPERRRCPGRSRLARQTEPLGKRPAIRPSRRRDPARPHAEADKTLAGVAGLSDPKRR